MADGQNALVKGAGALTRGQKMTVDCQADLDQIGSKLDVQLDILKSHFVGAGGLAFDRLKMEWFTQQRKVVKTLEEFERSLGISEKVINEVDDKYSADLSHINSRLGELPV